MSSDTAAALFRQTWNATPVQLGHPMMDDAMRGGLKTGEGFLLMGAPSTGKTMLLIQWMAGHLARGGRVVYVAAPQCKALDMHRVLISLEHAVCVEAAKKAENQCGGGGVPMQYQDAVAAAGGVDAVMDQVRATVSRFHVIRTSGIEDFCTIHTDEQVKALQSARVSQEEALTPLVVVDGLGAGCSFSTSEKAEGGTVPVGAAISKLSELFKAAVVVAETRPSYFSHNVNSVAADTADSLLRYSHTSGSCKNNFFKYVAAAKAEPLPPAQLHGDNPAPLVAKGISFKYNLALHIVASATAGQPSSTPTRHARGSYHAGGRSSATTANALPVAALPPTANLPPTVLHFNITNNGIVYC